MSEDDWAEAWSQLSRAVENAAGVMTEEEILDTVEEALPTDEPEYKPTGRKKPK